MATEDKMKEVGCIWLKQDKDQITYLSLFIEGQNYLGFKPKSPKEGDPDYWIKQPMADGKMNLVGRARKGVTKNERAKLDIRMNKISYLAIMRDGLENEPEDSKKAEMTVFAK